MNQYNLNRKRHGPWEQYYENGQLWYKGEFIDGKRHGPWERHINDGNLLAKGEYINDNYIGFWIWHNITNQDKINEFYL